MSDRLQLLAESGEQPAYDWTQVPEQESFLTTDAQFTMLSGTSFLYLTLPQPATTKRKMQIKINNTLNFLINIPFTN